MKDELLRLTVDSVVECFNRFESALSLVLVARKLDGRRELGRRAGLIANALVGLVLANDDDCREHGDDLGFPRAKMAAPSARR